MEENSKRRKRTQSTTSVQYSIYLEALESDYILRSGTVDPTVETDYIDTKWDELTLKLNSIGKGPALSKQSWQKRFKDWKNATRAKYRKIVECRNATGGGITETKVELTPLEERGLEVWGKVVVTGTPLVSITGGFKPSCTIVDYNATSTSDNGDKMCIDNVTNLNNEGDILETITILPLEDDTESCSYEEPSGTWTSTLITPPQKKAKQKKRLRGTKTRNLNEAAEKLKESFDANTEVISSIATSLSQFVETHKQTVKTEQRKLNFEIQKFSYEHKDCIFG